MEMFGGGWKRVFLLLAAAFNRQMGLPDGQIKTLQDRTPEIRK
jgi:hypothetical protein